MRLALLIASNKALHLTGRHYGIARFHVPCSRPASERSRSATGGHPTVEQPEPEVAARDAIRHWSRLPELAEFAALRHGFGDSDGGFGVTYPGDLDDYDHEVDGVCIPEGFVQAYGFWGPPNGYEL